ncbi:MAG TPA: branched-chain amino acid ABC transporter permease [Candidatus Dormibacteraeota bacterium]|nr:branched-chain amino acid ABC transporter permease [Candidatus Dormibacteraeota bacterium]
MRTAKYVLIALAAAAALAGPLTSANGFVRDMWVLIAMWGAVATAWNLIGGYGGNLSLGHAAFFGLGAYTSSLLYLDFHVSPWIGALAGGLVAMAGALAIGFITIRLRGPFFALATLAFAAILGIAATNLRGLTHGAEGMTIPFAPAAANAIFESKIAYYYVALALLLAYVAVTWWISVSRFGYYLVAIRENEDAAQALGIDAVRVKLAATLLSAFMTALVGSFYAQYRLFFEPSIFATGLSTQMALFAIIGGLGTVWGPLVGAAILVPVTNELQSMLGSALPGIDAFVYGAVLILAILFVPNGIVSLVRPLFAERGRARVRGAEREGGAYPMEGRE